MTYQNRRILLCLALSLLCLLTACQGQAEPSASPSAEESSVSAVTQEAPPESGYLPEEPSAAELAQSVYDAITDDAVSRDFYVEVTDSMSGRDTAPIHITPGSDPNVDFVGHYLFIFDWQYAEDEGACAGAAFTLTSADSETWLRCWEDSERVRLHVEGLDYFLAAAPGEDGQTLFQFMLNIPEDALIRQTWADIVIDGSVTDYNEVVERFARQRAENMNALPGWVPNKPNEAQYCGSGADQAYFGEGTENFCGYYSLYFKLENGEHSVWQAGSGMEQETEGDYAGWWKWIIGVYFARNENGDWICYDTGTGGAQLIFPTPLEEASLEQLVYYFFHTSGEGYHTNSIPSYICRQPVSELERLSSILAEYPAEEARELCLALGVYLADHPYYEGLAYEDLAPLLAEPYRGWLTEGFSPVKRSTAYDTRVTADEVVLHNGVRPGMTYEEVCALLGTEPQAPVGSDVFSVGQDNIHYGFYDLDGDGVFLLKHINISEEAVQASIFRDIKVGDSMESVLAKIPARDTELKKWAHQTLYGSDANDKEGYAWLEFVAMSYYAMRFRTPESHVILSFSRDQLRVKWIEIDILS